MPDLLKKPAVFIVLTLSASLSFPLRSLTQPQFKPCIKDEYSQEVTLSLNCSLSNAGRKPRGRLASAIKTELLGTAGCPTRACALDLDRTDDMQLVDDNTVKFFVKNAAVSFFFSFFFVGGGWAVSLEVSAEATRGLKVSAPRDVLRWKGERQLASTSSQRGLTKGGKLKVRSLVPLYLLVR